MWLQRWTIEQREYFLRQRALYRSIQRAIDKVYEKWPEAHRYEESSPKKYLYSKVGKKDFARVQAQIRDEAKNLPFSKTEFRVIALTEAAEKVIGEIRARERADGTVLSVRDFVALSGEFRQLLEAIRREMEPFVEPPPVLGLFERWVEATRDSDPS